MANLQHISQSSTAYHHFMYYVDEYYVEDSCGGVSRTQAE